MGQGTLNKSSNIFVKIVKCNYMLLQLNSQESYIARRLYASKIVTKDQPIRIMCQLALAFSFDFFAVSDIVTCQ